jgi:hypothetical protein
LLEQVRYTKQQLLDQKSSIHSKFYFQTYQNADKILLKDVIQLEQLCSVVQKYAFELNLGADILEFIGVVAQKFINMQLVAKPLSMIYFQMNHLNYGCSKS